MYMFNLKGNIRIQPCLLHLSLNPGYWITWTSDTNFIKFEYGIL